MFTSRDSVDHPVVISFIREDNMELFNTVPFDNLFFSTTRVVLATDGMAGIGSDIRIQFGTGVSPQSVDVMFGDANSQQITDMVVAALDNNGELYSTGAPNSLRVEDSRQRERELPVITVTTPGTAPLTASDFTVTEVQPGIPTTRQAGQTLIYTTGNTLDATNQWGFFTGVGAAATNTNPSAWPTTNIFLRINAGDFSSTDLQTTLGLAREPDATNQVVDSTFIVISAGAVSQGSTEFNQATYNVVGIQTVSATNLDVTLTLEVFSVALLAVSYTHLTLPTIYSV